MGRSGPTAISTPSKASAKSPGGLGRGLFRGSSSIINTSRDRWPTLDLPLVVPRRSARLSRMVSAMPIPTSNRRPIPAMVCCKCCAAKENDSDFILSRGASYTSRPGGLRPETVAVISPRSINFDDDEDEDVGRRRVQWPPVDPSHPSDSRSDCSALTPVFRGGQNSSFIFLDKKTNHGPYSESLVYTDGDFHDWDGFTKKSLWIADSSTPAEVAAHRQDWYDYIFPNVSSGNYVMRGLEQLYHTIEPFEDETAPTIAEFENWNLQVLNHFRNLLDIPPASYDPSLFLKTMWATERKRTGIWDAYGGEPNSAFGPCPPGSQIHCGETFVPSASDQSPYWNENYCGIPGTVTDVLTGSDAGSATVGTWPNGTAFTAMSRLLRTSFQGLSVTGHQGPFLLRPQLGYHIYGSDGAGFRTKWNGSVVTPPSGSTY